MYALVMGPMASSYNTAVYSAAAGGNRCAAELPFLSGDQTSLGADASY